MGASDISIYPGQEDVILPMQFRAVSADTTAVPEEFLQVNASSGPLTITLPTAPVVGTRVGVKKVDSTDNVVTVIAANSKLIDGDTNATIVSQWAGATFVYNGTDWYVHSPTFAAQFPKFQIGGPEPDLGSGIIWLRPVG